MTVGVVVVVVIAALSAVRRSDDSRDGDEVWFAERDGRNAGNLSTVVPGAVDASPAWAPNGFELVVTHRNPDLTCSLRILNRDAQIVRDIPTGNSCAVADW